MKGCSFNSRKSVEAFCNSVFEWFDGIELPAKSDEEDGWRSGRSRQRGRSVGGR